MAGRAALRPGQGRRRRLDPGRDRTCGTGAARGPHRAACSRCPRRQRRRPLGAGMGLSSTAGAGTKRSPPPGRRATSPPPTRWRPWPPPPTSSPLPSRPCAASTTQVAPLLARVPRRRRRDRVPRIRRQGPARGRPRRARPRVATSPPTRSSARSSPPTARRCTTSSPTTRSPTYAAAAVRAERRLEARTRVERALALAGPRTRAATDATRGPRPRAPGRPWPRPRRISPRAWPIRPGETWPFERAQLQLDYGEWLRRQRRINDAKPLLGSALDTFRRLGAAPWTRRADSELRACGVTAEARPVPGGALDGLTPQQREIADPRRPRPDQRRDRRPAVSVSPHGRLAPAPLLPQAGHRRPPPAPRPHRAVEHSADQRLGRASAASTSSATAAIPAAPGWNGAPPRNDRWNRRVHGVANQARHRQNCPSRRNGSRPGSVASRPAPRSSVGHHKQNVRQSPCLFSGLPPMRSRR